jgi:hypothetical protein
MLDASLQGPSARACAWRQALTAGHCGSGPGSKPEQGVRLRARLGAFQHRFKHQVGDSVVTCRRWGRERGRARPGAAGMWLAGQPRACCLFRVRYCSVRTRTRRAQGTLAAFLARAGGWLAGTSVVYWIFGAARWHGHAPHPALLDLCRLRHRGRHHRVALERLFLLLVDPPRPFRWARRAPSDARAPSPARQAGSRARVPCDPPSTQSSNRRGRLPASIFLARSASRSCCSS